MRRIGFLNVIWSNFRGLQTNFLGMQKKVYHSQLFRANDGQNSKSIKAEESLTSKFEEEYTTKSVPYAFFLCIIRNS